MALSIHARLAHRQSIDLWSVLKEVARVDAGEQFQCDVDDGGERFRRAYALIRQHGNDFIGQTVHFADDDKIWRKDRKEILGYIVDTPDLPDVTNPEIEYATGSDRCGGRLRPEVTVNLAA